MQVAEIIINSCYGGFSFSDKAIEEYKKKMIEIGNIAVLDNNYISKGEEKLRKDPIMIDIVRRLGKESNGRHANLEIEKYNAELSDYVVIKEYDGQEYIDANIQQYRIDLIKNVLKDIVLTDADKLIRIKEITERKIELY